ncbi:MAG TPA: SDR family oxidoreductase [Magnetospirillaceae bacterium]|jgi:nucleoside-diphosphate-sugar epimerase
MRVFVTGATGFVGTAVVKELLGNGHSVLGMARSDDGAAKLAKAGATVHRGDLQDLDSLKRGAAESDGVVHCGFIHDFSKFAENCAIDAAAIDAMGETLAGSNRPLIVTSGTGVLQPEEPGKAITEDQPQPNPSPFPRQSEEKGLAWATKGVRAMVVRLPPTTHGAGDHGFVPILINLAREKGAAAYVGEGLNVWSAGHRFDAAKVYRLALEKGMAGARYHAIAEEGIPFKDMAAVIGRHLNVPVVSKTKDEAAAHFGWFGHFAGMGNRSSSQKTRDALGWKPTEIGLVEDMEAHYFAK